MAIIIARKRGFLFVAGISLRPGIWSRLFMDGILFSGYDEERERPPPAPRQDLSNSIISAEDADPTRKRKKSRWAETTEARAFIPGMPTIIPANLSREQEKTYLRKFSTVNSRRCQYSAVQC